MHKHIMLAKTRWFVIRCSIAVMPTSAEHLKTHFACFQCLCTVHMDVYSTYEVSLRQCLYYSVKFRAFEDPFRVFPVPIYIISYMYSAYDTHTHTHTHLSPGHTSMPCYRYDIYSRYHTHTHSLSLSLSPSLSPIARTHVHGMLKI